MADKVRQELGDNNGQPFRLSSKDRHDKWTTKELEILARPELTDYQKAKLLSGRRDAAVRIKRKRMGFTSKPVVFNRQFDHNGYVMVRRNGGYERRNRVVVEEHIGRSLSSKEVVHHINGRKNDDRIENLYLCATKSEHNAIHAQTIHVIGELMEKNIVKFEKGRYVLC